MHGVKRTTETASEAILEQIEQEQPQITHYKELLRRLLKLRNEQNTGEILSISKEILLINPDFMTAWNARKEALLIDVKVKEELEFTVEAIKLNPKSYGAWYHRRWLMERLRQLSIPYDVAYELKLCNKLLEIDSRNFHCWNYRWYLTETFKDVNMQGEFDFTTLMIYRNFSNYSAWHRRSVLFPRLVSIMGEESIRADLRLIKSAYFTEPADQSSWFYLRWILDFAKERFPADGIRWHAEALEGIEELLQIEPESPLALSNWVYLAKKIGLSPEVITPKLQTLMEIDPLRYNLYSSLYNHQ